MFGSNTKFETRVLDKGEIFIQEGKNLSNIYILTSGRVLNFSVNKGRVIPLYMSIESGVIGEDCVLGNQKVCSYNSIAMENSRVLVIPKKNVTKVLNDSSDWIRKVILNISERAANTSNLIIEHQIKSDALHGDRPFENQDEKFILGQLAKIK